MLKLMSPLEIIRVNFARFKLRYGHLQLELPSHEKIEKFDIRAATVHHNRIERPGTGGRERICLYAFDAEATCADVQEDGTLGATYTANARLEFEVYDEESK